MIFAKYSVVTGSRLGRGRGWILLAPRIRLLIILSSISKGIKWIVCQAFTPARKLLIAVLEYWPLRKVMNPARIVVVQGVRYISGKAMVSQ